MGKQTREDLSLYVSRIINIKKLSAREVALRSDGGITAGYVTGIMNGTAKNPSVEKMKALAQGLGVSVDELFHVACGQPDQQADTPQVRDRFNSLLVLDLMQKVLVSSELTGLLQKVVRLSPEEQSDVLRFINNIHEDAKTSRASGG